MMIRRSGMDSKKNKIPFKKRLINCGRSIVAKDKMAARTSEIQKDENIRISEYLQFSKIKGKIGRETLFKV
jgi:translation initiation factor 6 (eIF-6)